MSKIEVGDTVIVTDDGERFEGVVEEITDVGMPDGEHHILGYVVNGKYGLQTYLLALVELESKCIEIGDTVEVTDDEHEEPYQGKVINILYEGPDSNVIESYLVKGANFVLVFDPKQVRLVRK